MILECNHNELIKKVDKKREHITSSANPSSSDDASSYKTESSRFMQSRMSSEIGIPQDKLYLKERGEV